MLCVAFLEFDLISKFLYENILSPIKEKVIAYASPPVILILTLVVVLIFVIVRIISKNNKFKSIGIKTRSLIEGVIEGFKSVSKMKNNWLFIFHTLFIWIMYFFMTYVCFFALDATSHLGMKEGLFVLVIGGLAMSAPVQGGIGAYHWIVSQGLMLFNISQTDGIVFATLVHTYQTLTIIVLGLSSLIILGVLRRKNANNESSSEN